MDRNIITELDERYIDELMSYLPDYSGESAEKITRLFYEKTAAQPKAKRKPVIRTFLIAATIAILSAATALAYSEAFRLFIFGRPANVVVLGDDTALVVDRMSQEDIYNLMKLIIDEDGKLVENHGVLRQRYVYEMDRFNVVGEDGLLREIQGNPFTVRLNSSGEGDFEYRFYSLDVSGKLIAVPSEWNVMAFLFLANERLDNFFACTDTGIYRIDPVSRSATLISGATFNGIAYEELFRKFSDAGGLYLSWIANPALSPDGQWIVYQSNRNDAGSLPSLKESLWVINTKTGEERLIPVRGEYTQVPQGFLSENTLLVKNAGGNDTFGINFSVVDIITGESIQLDFGYAPNAHISDIHKSGLLAIQVYDESGARELIYRISNDGECTLITEINGNLQYVRFSPDGKNIAAVLRAQQDEAVDTVLIINTSTGLITTISELENGAYASALSWVKNGQFIITENTSSDGRIREATVLFTLKGD
jgi:hypothetical protein